MHRAPRDVDQARTAYCAKGSLSPIPGECGARLAKRHGLGPETPWRYCTHAPLHGRTRCKLHGGKSLTGLAHPRYSGGGNPFAAGSALADGYNRLRADTDYLTVKEQMRLLSARERECVARIVAAGGESAGAWLRLRSAIRRALGAQTSGNVAIFAAALDEMRTLACNGAAREEVFRELREIADLRARLSETEAKLLERNHATMTVEQVLSIANAIAGLVSRCIVLARQSEQAALREWAAGIKALTGGLG